MLRLRGSMVRRPISSWVDFGVNMDWVQFDLTTNTDQKVMDRKDAITKDVIGRFGSERRRLQFLLSNTRAKRDDVRDIRDDAADNRDAVRDKRNDVRDNLDLVLDNRDDVRDNRDDARDNLDLVRNNRNDVRDYPYYVRDNRDDVRENRVDVRATGSEGHSPKLSDSSAPFL
ncbi:hypothetical protein LSAT2_025237 [Lamellibrachia satsuma]|nr:hypothetical protein LSAT2_025237 [Lamellibrachia satsuma]